VSRIVAIIDGEHYPPVVRFALEELAKCGEVVAAVFAGGTEKVDGDGTESYGVPVVMAVRAADALAEALATYAPDEVVDLSDEPVLAAADRFRLASVALAAGSSYRGADFAFTPPVCDALTRTPALAVIGTGKRVGKTAISAYAARRLTAAGRHVVVLAMGRGGPAEPELIRGDQVALTTADLLALAAKGVHASSDCYEDAVMSRVATVGCRRCGGGLAGATFFSNAAEGAALADSLGGDLMLLEGSGSAIPPVRADARLLVIGAAQGPGYVTDYFGPLRLALADVVVVAGAEAPVASQETVAGVLAAVRATRPDIPCVSVVFRPRPLQPVAGAQVFFATTAPPALVPTLAAHLEREHGCTVVASSANLSDRLKLREDLAEAGGTFDLLVTELKAAAIDVVAAVGKAAGVPTVLCDNVPVPAEGAGLDAAIDDVAALASSRAAGRDPR
jgi:cyclic 2,3-diphosphoglycerate synthetase